MGSMRHLVHYMMSSSPFGLLTCLTLATLNPITPRSLCGSPRVRSVELEEVKLPGLKGKPGCSGLSISGDFQTARFGHGVLQLLRGGMYCCVPFTVSALCVCPLGNSAPHSYRHLTRLRYIKPCRKTKCDRK